MDPWDQRLARRLVRPLAGTRVTPNQLTTLSLVTGLAGAAALAVGGPGWAEGGAVLFALSLFLDHTDGELARLTGRGSAFGARYDTAVSAVTKVALFLGIGLGLQDGGLGGWAPVMGLVAGLAVAFIFWILEDLKARGGRAAAAQPAAFGFEAEDSLYLLVPVAWLGGLAPFLALSALGAPAFAGWLLWRRAGLDKR